MAVFAHPDDEITVAGTVALYAESGAEVTVVCTTNGAGGMRPDGLSSLDLGRTRRAELTRACEILGVKRLDLLEPLDEGHPHLGQQNYQDLAYSEHRRRLRDLVAEIVPDIVIGFGPDGVTGHPTHVLVGRLTGEAVDDLDEPPPLYRVAYTDEHLRKVTAWMAAHPGLLADYADEVEKAPNIGPPTPELIPVPDSAIAVAIDVTPVIAKKTAAIACHESQGGSGLLQMFATCTTESFAARSGYRQTPLPAGRFPLG